MPKIPAATGQSTRVGVDGGRALQSYQPLTVTVDIYGLHMLPGSSPSNQFMGWTFADPDGKSAAGVARDLMIQLCEYTLHLDDFERLLGQEPL